MVVVRAIARAGARPRHVDAVVAGSEVEIRGYGQLESERDGSTVLRRIVDDQRTCLCRRTAVLRREPDPRIPHEDEFAAIGMVVVHQVDRTQVRGSPAWVGIDA